MHLPAIFSDTSCIALHFKLTSLLPLQSQMKDSSFDLKYNVDLFLTMLITGICIFR